MFILTPPIRTSVWYCYDISYIYPQFLRKPPKFFISSKEKTILVADDLRDKGYSVNTAVMFGYSGVKRYEISVALPKKDKSRLHEILFDHGIENPTFIETDVSKVGGKIMRNE